MMYIYNISPLPLTIIIVTTILLSSSVTTEAKPAIPAACRDDKLTVIRAYIDCYYEARRNKEGGQGLCYNPFWEVYSDLSSCDAASTSLKKADYLYAGTIKDLTQICWRSKLSEADCDELNAKLIDLKFDTVVEEKSEESTTTMMTEATTSATTTTTTPPNTPPPIPPGPLPAPGVPVYKCMHGAEQYLISGSECDVYASCDPSNETGCITHDNQTGHCLYQKTCVPQPPPCKEEPCPEF